MKENAEKVIDNEWVNTNEKLSYIYNLLEQLQLQNTVAMTGDLSGTVSPSCDVTERILS
jgi:hypothetical protein